MRRALLVVVLALVGCSEGAPTAYVVHDFGGSTVKLVTLNDGTKCAIYVGNGISCDWQQQKPELPK